MLANKMLCHDDFTNISGIQSVVSVNMRKVFLKALATNKIKIIGIIVVINTLIEVFPSWVFHFLTLNRSKGQINSNNKKILIYQCLLHGIIKTIKEF